MEIACGNKYVPRSIQAGSETQLCLGTFISAVFFVFVCFFKREKHIFVVILTQTPAFDFIFVLLF